MQTETQAKISKMLYHLSTENRAAADAELRAIVKSKVQNAFDKQYQKVKDSFSQEK